MRTYFFGAVFHSVVSCVVTSVCMFSFYFIYCGWVAYAACLVFDAYNVSNIGLYVGQSKSSWSFPADGERAIR
jgi:hypothetical protein